MYAHICSLVPKVKFLTLRDYIENVVRVIGQSSPLWTKFTSQDPSQLIISVDACPQQADTSWTAGSQYVISYGHTYTMKTLLTTSLILNGVDYKTY
ncbi:hypothetical protein CsSME_00031183 [Camellia sinensis var. sinensis]